MIGINYNFQKRRMIEANRGRRIKIKRPNIIYTGVLGAGGGTEVELVMPGVYTFAHGDDR